MQAVYSRSHSDRINWAKTVTAEKFHKFIPNHIIGGVGHKGNHFIFNRVHNVNTPRVQMDAFVVVGPWETIFDIAFDV